MNGWLLLNKPAGITSRAAVNQAQSWFPKGTKIGHTGTLDPRATGLLVLAVGQATRFADYVQEQGKTYRALIRLGAASDTDDADGTVEERPGAAPVPREQLLEALSGLVGVIQQVPPGYSAIKVNGQRAHALARQGEVPQLAARPVRIDRVQLLHYGWPFADVEIDCGKGTYIRSLARDLGQLLGVGGLIQELHRSRVGAFRVESALTLTATTGQAQAALLPIEAALLHLNQLQLDTPTARQFQQGQWTATDHPEAAVLRIHGNRFLGLGRIQQGRLQPLIVVPPASD